MHSIAALKIYGKFLLGRKFLGTTTTPEQKNVTKYVLVPIIRFFYRNCRLYVGILHKKTKKRQGRLLCQSYIFSYINECI